MEEEERTRRIQEDLKALAESQLVRRQSGIIADSLAEEERLYRERSESFKNLAKATKPLREKIQQVFLSFP
jgi:DeoR/GlpR family transcriptional regulator of sugar metabolism